MVKSQITYTRKKLELLSQINNQTKFEHKHVVIYYGNLVPREILKNSPGTA